MMDAAALRKQFGLTELVTFEEFNGMTRMLVHTPRAQATIFLQGAHLTAWQPARTKPVIFVSRKSEYVPGKAIRGGIPVVFPWFATDTKKDRVDGHTGPSHGFARLQDWELTTVTPAPGELLVGFRLGPTAMSRSMGFDRFTLTMEFAIGQALRVTLTVHNESDAPLQFEEAFHTYYHVADVHELRLTGLEATPFIDKTDNFKLTAAAGEALHPVQFTDRIYNGTAATCVLHDLPATRKIEVQKTGSKSTVLFNPWKAMPDLDEWEWHEFLAVETANVGTDSITLAPGASHAMQMDVTVTAEEA